MLAYPREVGHIFLITTREEPQICCPISTYLPKSGEVKHSCLVPTTINAHVSPIQATNVLLNLRVTNNLNDAFTDSPAVYILLLQYKQMPKGFISLNLVLIYSGSSVHIFTNGKLLTNLYKTLNNKRITVNTLGGPVETCLQGDLPRYGCV